MTVIAKVSYFRSSRSEKPRYSFINGSRYFCDSTWYVLANTIIKIDSSFSFGEFMTAYKLLSPECTPYSCSAMKKLESYFQTINTIMAILQNYDMTMTIHTLPTSCWVIFTPRYVMSRKTYSITAIKRVTSFKSTVRTVLGSKRKSEPRFWHWINSFLSSVSSCSSV